MGRSCKALVPLTQARVIIEISLSIMCTMIPADYKDRWAQLTHDSCHLAVWRFGYASVATFEQRTFEAVPQGAP